MVDRDGRCWDDAAVEWALIVDGDPLLRDSLRLYLETLGWRALVAEHAGAATAALRMHPVSPRLVVVGAERASWLPLIRQLAAGRNAPPTVMLFIGKTSAEAIGEVERQGIAVVCWPIPPLNLEGLLQDCSRHARRHSGTAPAVPPAPLPQGRCCG